MHVATWNQDLFHVAIFQNISEFARRLTEKLHPTTAPFLTIVILSGLVSGSDPSSRTIANIVRKNRAELFSQVMTRLINLSF